MVFVADMGERQGPVSAASRLTVLLQACRVQHVGMVGICGGAELGRLDKCLPPCSRNRP